MTATATLATLEINGVTYAPVGPSSNSLPSGNRHVVVIDRGWIFAGNVTVDDVTKEIIISDVLHVIRWEGVGFHGVLENPKSSKVNLEPIPYPVKVPSESVIFTVPVVDTWGK